MNRRSFTKASVKFAGVLAVAACVPEPKASAAVNNEKLDAAIRRMRVAVKNIAED